jgi:hypothetical protein
VYELYCTGGAPVANTPASTSFSATSSHTHRTAAADHPPLKKARLEPNSSSSSSSSSSGGGGGTSGGGGVGSGGTPSAAHPQNQHIVDTFVELRTVCLQAEPDNAGTKAQAYHKSSQAYGGVPYPITLGNALTLGPGGSNKLDGVGKASMDKLIEYLHGALSLPSAASYSHTAVLVRVCTCCYSRTAVLVRVCRCCYSRTAVLVRVCRCCGSRASSAPAFVRKMNHSASRESTLINLLTVALLRSFTPLQEDWHDWKDGGVPGNPCHWRW